MSEYLAFHYLEPKSLLPKNIPVPRGVKLFPAACAQLLISHADSSPLRALDLGCAVGCSSFILTQCVHEVVGVDFSHSFIRAANQLKKSGQIRFMLKEEGALAQKAIAKVPRKAIRRRVRFIQGDALRLPKGLGTFDLVLAANLIDRLPDPEKFLRNVLPSLLHQGGHVLLTSPYTWSEQFTPRAKWLQNSFPTLRSILQSHFRLLSRQNLPFLLREHQRKFQYTFADATIWQRR